MELLNQTQVREVMIKPIKTITKDISVYVAAKNMLENNIGSLIVTDRIFNDNEIINKENVIGMIPILFTLDKILEIEDREKGLVSSSMFSDLIFIHEEAPLSYALSKVTNNKTWRLVAVNRLNQVVGILSAADIIKFLNERTVKDFHLQIGQNTSYFGISISWSNNNTIILTRQEEFVTEISDVIDLYFEQRNDDETDQSMLFLKVFSKDNKTNAFFLDADPVQTNAREVDSSLNNLTEVLNWLLPSDYFCRQGDIGFYKTKSIPEGAIEVSKDEYGDYFEKPFHKRHIISPKENCNFYVMETGRYFIRVNGQAFIIHPEHHPEELPLGLLEVVCAKGEPLPKIIGLKEGEAIDNENLSKLSKLSVQTY